MSSNSETVPADAFDGAAIAKIMTMEGPVVACVLIHPDGKAEEIQLDMTPKKDMCGKTLGGSITLQGQWPEIDCVIMSKRDTDADAPINKHNLPMPFDKATIRGAVLLVRMDEDSEPQPLTLKECVPTTCPWPGVVTHAPSHGASHT